MVPKGAVGDVQERVKPGKYGIARVVPVPAVPLETGNENRQPVDKGAGKPAPPCLRRSAAVRRQAGEQRHGAGGREEKAEILSARVKPRHQAGEDGIPHAPRAHRVADRKGSGQGEQGEPGLDLAGPAAIEHRRGGQEQKRRRQGPVEAEVAAADDEQQGAHHPAADHGPEREPNLAAQAQRQQVGHLRQKGCQPFGGAGDEFEPAGRQELLGQGEVIGERIGVRRRRHPFQHVEDEGHGDGAQQGAPAPIRLPKSYGGQVGERPGAGRGAAQKDHAGRRHQAQGQQLGPGDMTGRGGEENQPADHPEAGGETPRHRLATVEIAEHAHAREHRGAGPEAGGEKQEHRAQCRHGRPGRRWLGSTGAAPIRGGRRPSEAGQGCRGT